MSEAQRNQPAPVLCPSNPGIGIEAQFKLTSEHGPPGEDIHVVNIAANVFKYKRNHTIQNAKTHLQHPDSGFLLLPQLVQIQLLDDGFQTVTTMQINHPVLAPNGVFEYQHSTGDTL